MSEPLLKVENLVQHFPVSRTYTVKAVNGVSFNIYPGETYPLKLISVTPKANANQLYTMRLQVVPGTPAVPSPGMNTMVTISYRTEQTNTLSVPTGAILQKEGKAYVFVFNPSDNTVHKQEISMLRLLNLSLIHI